MDPTSNASYVSLFDSILPNKKQPFKPRLYRFLVKKTDLTLIYRAEIWTKPNIQTIELDGELVLDVNINFMITGSMKPIYCHHIRL